MNLHLMAVLSILVTTVITSQAVFTSPANLGISQGFQVAPAGTLDILSETSFTALAHPNFPNYGVRIKKSNFCDATVGAYTGYIDIEARHLFFSFFESRSEPDRDDVVFWTNGGCSSAVGLFMELGPCRIASAANGTTFPPESCNSKPNLFFIDQPIGVGFSYADHGEKVGTTEDVAKDIAAFAAIFFAHFKNSKAADSTWRANRTVAHTDLYSLRRYKIKIFALLRLVSPINLTSVIIGNGMTDIIRMVPAWVDMQCSPASMPSTPPIQNIKTCVHMKTILPRCQKWLKESCEDQFHLIDCNAAGREIIEYLNKEDFQKLLGARPGPYMTCSQKVGLDFGVTLDLAKGATEYVAALLERNVRVLIFAGSYDWVCNWVGNERWTRALQWSGQAEFGADTLREWSVNGRRAGSTRSARGLTFATVDTAGHMVPYDKPKEAFEMVIRWLAGKPL
ncbi:serine carboxypeptidase [Mycena rebaudengoi]|nr:serine carboxypeptidase [Mycena rebaudengoi]